MVLPKELQCQIRSEVPFGSCHSSSRILLNSNMADSRTTCLDLLIEGHVNSYIKFFMVNKNEDDIKQLQSLLVAVECAFRSANEYQILEATTQLAQHFLKRKDFDNSLENFQAALTASKRLKEYIYEVDALCHLGSALLQCGRTIILNPEFSDISIYIGNLNDALVNFGKARDLAISRNDTERDTVALDLMMKTNIAIGKQVCVHLY